MEMILPMIFLGSGTLLMMWGFYSAPGWVQFLLSGYAIWRLGVEIAKEFKNEYQEHKEP